VRKLFCLIAILGVVVVLASDSYAPPDVRRGRQLWTDPDGDPNQVPFSEITVSSGTLADDGDGTGTLNTGGGGDSVTVNGVAVDTTANFLDGGINWTRTDGGAGGPDDVTGVLDATTLDAITWSDGANASNLWTFNVSGTDPTVTWGSALATLAGNWEVSGTVPRYILTDSNGNNFEWVIDGSVLRMVNTTDGVTSLIHYEDNSAGLGELGFLPAYLQFHTSVTGNAGFRLQNNSIGPLEIDSTTGAYDFGSVTSFELPNSATPTTDVTGEIALDTSITDHQPLWQYFDSGENMTVIAIDTSQLPAADNEIVKYDAATNKFVLEADAGGGGTANLSYELLVQTTKITGSFVTDGDSTQGAAIDAGDGNWRLLFDATTDEAGIWQFRMPNNYSSAPVLHIGYSMASATADDVEFEGSIMCISDGDEVDVGTPSFSTIATGTETVPGTAGFPSEISITLNDDSCTAADTVWVKLSTDADDGTNDDATGDREVIHLSLTYTGS